jgi:hypothetical protein
MGPTRGIHAHTIPEGVMHPPDGCPKRGSYLTPYLVPDIGCKYGVHESVCLACFTNTSFVLSLAPHIVRVHLWSHNIHHIWCGVHTPPVHPPVGCGGYIPLYAPLEGTGTLYGIPQDGCATHQIWGPNGSHKWTYLVPTLHTKCA